MKLPRRPLTRVLALTTTGLLVVGAGAVADTIPVTLGVVNGARSLTVTGSNGTIPTGAPALAFAGTGTTAPFGVVVTDVLYERKGYTVDATLSNLYKLGTTGVLCEAAIPSSAFSITYATRPAETVEAVVDTTLTFVDANLKEDLIASVPLIGTALAGIVGDLPVTVSSVKGVVQEYGVGDVTNALDLMDAADGNAESFAAQAAHPQCADSGATTPKSVLLQTGTKKDPTQAQLDALWNELFTDADTDTATALSAIEAMVADLLPDDATAAPGGSLYTATRSAISSVLLTNSLSGLVSDLQLDAVTALVIADLRAAQADVVFDLIGQSGVYPNLPILNLDRDLDGDPTTGTYHGVMTVTLTDGS